MKSVKNNIAVVCVIFASVLLAQAEIKPRVSGLENDSVYMSLLFQERDLKHQEDSLNRSIASLRETFAADTTSRAEKGRQLMAMEAELFDVKTKMGRVVSQSGAIEQQAIINSMASPAGSVAAGSSTPEYSGMEEYLKKSLSPEEYEQFKSNSALKLHADKLVERYREIYEEITGISLAYDTIDSPRTSDSLYNAYRLLRDEIYDMEEYLDDTWGEAVNNNIYLYSLLLDKQNKVEEIEALYEKGRNAKVQPAGVMSVPLAEYPLQRSLLLSYEISLASVLGLDKAADSIKAVQKTVEDEMLNFPDISLKRKDYVDFTEVTITTPPVYNASNPIPRLSMPDYGTYYGVVVGTYANPVSVSTFRGANPVYLERLRNGQYRYYVGLYRTLGEAYESTAMLKREGFRRPEVVSWTDGKYENLAAVITANEGLFSVQIKGISGEPGRAVKYEIEKYARNKDVTRSGSDYSIGLFNNRLHARELADALAGINGLEVSVVEIGGDEE